MMYLLESSRLSFRKMEATDFESLVLLDTDPMVRAFFPTGVLREEEINQKIEKNQKSFEVYGFSDFIIEDKSTHQFLGRGGFTRMDDGEVEVGYLFLKEFWGVGYATEAIKALLEWGFLHIKPEYLPHSRIISFAPMHHVASHNVMEKGGMTHFKDGLYQGVQCKFYEIKRV